MKLQTLYNILEIAGIFAFSISGATAARQRGLDLFGIVVIAFIVACGGGIVRDLCIGAIPPAGLNNWAYLVTAVLAAGVSVISYPLVKKLDQPVLLFDAAGLSLFAVTGAQKTLSYGHSGQMAVLLGIVTAVGGGVLRDILLNRVPVILQKEIYATAALAAALIVSAGNYLNVIPNDWVSLIAISVCFVIRLLALKYQWKLPATKI